MSLFLNLTIGYSGVDQTKRKFLGLKKECFGCFGLLCWLRTVPLWSILINATDENSWSISFPLPVGSSIWKSWHLSHTCDDTRNAAIEWEQRVREDEWGREKALFSLLWVNRELCSFSCFPKERKIRKKYICVQSYCHYFSISLTYIRATVYNMGKFDQFKF